MAAATELVEMLPLITFDVIDIKAELCKFGKIMFWLGIPDHTQFFNVSSFRPLILECNILIPKRTYLDRVVSIHPLAKIG